RTMMVLLKAVVQYGTGSAALSLGHPLGGKTGTTNNYTDAWFVGFSPSVTCGTWIGFDDRESLGKRETGAKAALPMWIDFMRAADAKSPKEAFATALAPKKTLNVPVAPTELPSVRPPVKDTDDSDADDDGDEERLKIVTPGAGQIPAARPGQVVAPL
ncbi:MAG: penicillin-binding protein, partial [Granulicella sp.]